MQADKLRSFEQELGAAGQGLVGNFDVLRSILSAKRRLHQDSGLGRPPGIHQRRRQAGDGSRQLRQALKGCPWPDFWEGAGNREAKQALAAAVASGTGSLCGGSEYRERNPKYWDVHVSPILGEDGKPSHVLSISRDITEEHGAALALDEAAARQEMLTRELEHRIKNTLTTVSAIANQTLRGDQYTEVRHALTSRLIALGQVHDILTRGNWVGARIADVVESWRWLRIERRRAHACRRSCHRAGGATGAVVRFRHALSLRPTH